MEFIYIIAIVVVGLVVHGQSKRIKKVEDKVSLLERSTQIHGQATTQTQGQAPAQAQTPTQPLNQASPRVTDPALIADIQKLDAGRDVSGEESSGRLLGGIGIAAVIIGIAFFLKFAFDNNWIGPSGRVMIGIVAGLILLALGQILRKKYLNYSDMLMGGGIVVLYLSIFSAHFFFQLISPFVAGVFMAFVTALGLAISIANGTLVLGVVSVLGGFATPFMANSGTNEMVSLFGYITILNLGVLGVSFFKKWPELILIAFVGTVLNFIVWFASYYNNTFLAPTLIFCFITFLIFLIASVARAINEKSTVDNLNYFLLGAGAFLFATITYTLLNPDYHSSLGFIAVCIAVIYMLVAFVINKFNPEDKTLNIFLPGLAVTFLSLAVPLQFSGSWIAVSWLVESLILYYIALSIGNRGFQVMGVVVYILGLLNLFFWNFPNAYDKGFIVFFNPFFIMLVLAIGVAYTIASIYRRYGSATVDIQKRGIVAFVIIANILTVCAFSSQIIFYHNAQITQANENYRVASQEAARYNTGNSAYTVNSDLYKNYTDSISSTQNTSNTYVSIFWTIYAALLTAIGFGYRKSSARRLGLTLFIITAIKVFFDVWSLGQIYRIVSFIVFGVIALAASFAYTKYRDRLKEIL